MSEHLATIKVTLFVESSVLSIEQLSERIGVTCDFFHLKGSLRGKTQKVREANWWELSAKEEVAEDPLLVGEKIRELLIRVLDRIDGHETGFKSVAEGSTSGLVVGLSADSVPPLDFDAALLRRIDKLGTGLEIDLTLH